MFNDFRNFSELKSSMWTQELWMYNMQYEHHEQVASSPSGDAMPDTDIAHGGPSSPSTSGVVRTSGRMPTPPPTRNLATTRDRARHGKTRAESDLVIVADVDARTWNEGLTGVLLSRGLF
eukprot:240367-Rhodomonas_salina.2